MTRRLARRGLVLGACLLASLSTACTPSDPPPPPPSTSAPSPTENAQEREERLAYEAAETSYREFRAEVERVYSRGGAAKPTSVMKTTAGGQYLKYYQDVSEAYHGLRHRSEGRLRIAYVNPNGYTPKELLLDVCEDGSGVTTYDAKGNKLYTDDVRKLQLTARPSQGTWIIWSGEGKKVSSCG